MSNNYYNPGSCSVTASYVLAKLLLIAALFFSAQFQVLNVIKEKLVLLHAAHAANGYEVSMQRITILMFSLWVLHDKIAFQIMWRKN